MANSVGFDINFLWLSLYQCNLDCSYCSNYFLTKEFKQIPTIDIEKLIASLDNSGKICRIVFTGGEPFLIPNFIEACQRITVNHRVIVISNFTTNKIKEFADKIDPSKAGFLSSLHIRELENKKLTDRYIENYHYLINKGFGIGVEEVAYPGLLEDAKRYTVF